MLITSHLAATVLVGESLSLGPSELMVALLGGVALDVDHFFISTKWIVDIKNFFYEGRISHGEVRQHSFIQEPILGMAFGITLGFIVSLLWPSNRWWIFPLFQAIHIGMDAFMKYEHRPFIPLREWSYRGWLSPGTKGELIGSSIACAAAAMVWLL